MFSYENLDVYKIAYALNSKIYRALKENSSIPGYVKSQLGRASLSIVLNIAEGSAKFGTKDRKNFYTTARGSVFECAAILNFLRDENELDPNLVEDVLKDYDTISRMLYGLINSLNQQT